MNARELRDPFDEGSHLAEFKFFESSRRLAIREELRRRVARPLADPIVRLPVRKRPSRERVPEPVGSEAERVLPPLKEPSARDLGLREVHSNDLREVTEVKLAVPFVQKDESVGRGKSPELVPGAKGIGDAWTHLPPSRVLRLVLVELNDLVLEVELAPLKTGALGPSATFAVQEAVEDTIRERHLFRSEEFRVF